MDKSVLSFSEIKPNQDFMRQVFELDVRTLSSVDDLTISQYALALSQYLIFFKYQQNLSRADVFKLERALELSVSQLLTDDIMKQYKTKVNATAYIISNTADLYAQEKKLEEIKSELMLLEGIDKMIQEYIATLKRELTRREQELWETKMERR